MDATAVPVRVPTLRDDLGITEWVETTHGPALRIQVRGKFVSFYPFDLKEPEHVAATAAISLWEGEAGLCPRGILARWRWRCGLRRLRRQITEEVKAHITE